MKLSPSWISQRTLLYGEVPRNFLRGFAGVSYMEYMAADSKTCKTTRERQTDDARWSLDGTRIACNDGLKNEVLFYTSCTLSCLPDSPLINNLQERGRPVFEICVINHER